MSMNVQCCFEDEQVNEMMEKMADSQIRRVPVTGLQNRLVNLVSLSDPATGTTSDQDVQ